MAAADLEGALGVGFFTVRDAALELFLACIDHEVAQEDLRKAEAEMVVRKAEREVRKAEEEKKAAQPTRWWKIWGWSLHRLVNKGGVHEHLLTDGEDQETTLSMEFIAEEIEKAGQVKGCGDRFITVLRELGAIPADEEMAGAMSALVKAIKDLKEGVAASSVLVVVIRKAAADVQGRLDALIAAFRAPAAKLVSSCDKYLEGEDAMAAVLRAATEQEQAQAQAQAQAQTQRRWHRWFWRKDAKGDLEAQLLVKQMEPTAALPSTPADKPKLSEVDKVMAEKTSSSQAYALFGSLSVLPDFGKVFLKSSWKNENFLFTWLFCPWWSTVAMGVWSSIYPRTPPDRVVAHLTSRIGLMGINIMVVFYTCLLLGADTTATLAMLLSFVIVGHIFLAILQYRRN